MKEKNAVWGSTLLLFYTTPPTPAKKIKYGTKINYWNIQFTNLYSLKSSVELLMDIKVLRFSEFILRVIKSLLNRIYSFLLCNFGKIHQTNDWTQ